MTFAKFEIIATLDGVKPRSVVFLFSFVNCSAVTLSRLKSATYCKKFDWLSICFASVQVLPAGAISTMIASQIRPTSGCGVFMALISETWLVGRETTYALAAA